MKREGTIGAATLLAIAAVVGVSVQTGPKQSESGGTGRTAEAKRAPPSIEKRDTHKEMPGCASLQEALGDFLAVENLPLPGPCYETGVAPPDQHPENLTNKTSRLKFVIALMPDPVHTHLSAVFDQFAVAIQEGAQDEKYDFDSSWLPWDDEEASYTHLADEKASIREKKLKENQPGIILFRKMPRCSEEILKRKESCAEEVSTLYTEGLIVFVVGEEATHGIHAEQFNNALEWIRALHPTSDTNDNLGKRLAILGPTFSGSFPSLAHVLRDANIAGKPDLDHKENSRRLAIYSGSVSSNPSAHFFQDTFAGQVVFHSFVQNDDEILDRFCAYMKREQPGFDLGRVTIISEDETAYGAQLETSADAPPQRTTIGRFADRRH